MISESEAQNINGALTSEQYTELLNGKADLAYETVIEQYGPDWSVISGEAHATAVTLDAIKAGSTIVQAYYLAGWIVERLATEPDTFEAVTLSVQPAVSSSNLISLGSTGAAVRLFYYDGADIRYVECADIAAGSPSFGSSVLALTQASVVGLAAISTTKLYIAYLNAKKNRVLAVLEYSGGSWTKTDSDVYWPFPFDAFDAVTLNGRDVIAFSGDLPPLWGTRAVGLNVSSTFNRVQGVVLFTVSNGRWSDYQVFDVIDRDVYGLSRLNLRLSAANGYAFMTYDRHMIFRKYDTAGALLTPNSALRRLPVVARTKTGLDWELPEMVLKPTAPFVVLPGTNYLYALGAAGPWVSHACTWAGMSAARTQTVSSRTLDIRSTAADVRQTTLELSNPYVAGTPPTLALNGTLVDLNLRLRLRLYLGYNLAIESTEGNEPIAIWAATEDIEQRMRVANGPRNLIGLHSADGLHRLSRVRSDYAAEWPGQTASRDAFVDETGTGYGGLKHLAPIEGQWKAADGILNLVSSLHRSLVESVLITDTMNGSAQIGFKLNDAGQKEYGGIAFRLLDKDNYFYVFYDIESDTIQLCRNMSGPDTVYATSAAMSWDSDTANYHYLRVEVRYSLVRVFTSTDAVTWAELTWSTGSGELPGQESLSNTPYVVWSGKFGIVGKGYSDVDEPPPIDPPVYDPPDPPVFGTSSVKEAWLLGLETGLGCSLMFTLDFDGTTDVNNTSWHKVDEGDLPAIFAPAWVGDLHIAPDGSQLYIAGAPARDIIRCTNLAAVRANPATLPTWETISSDATETGSGWFERRKIGFWKDQVVVIGLAHGTITQTCYGIYTPGSGWVFTVNNTPSTAGGYQSLSVLAQFTEYSIYTTGRAVRQPVTGTYLEDFGSPGGEISPLWRPYSSTTANMCVAVKNLSDSNYKVRYGSSFAGEYALPATRTAGSIFGAQLGNELFVVDSAGQLHFSLDGSTFTAAEQGSGTWATGKVFSAKQAGGAAAVWIRYNAPGSNEVIRVALTGPGSDFINKTGNFWSVHGGGAFSITDRPNGNFLVYQT